MDSIDAMATFIVNGEVKIPRDIVDAYNDGTVFGKKTLSFMVDNYTLAQYEQFIDTLFGSYDSIASGEPEYLRDRLSTYDGVPRTPEGFVLQLCKRTQLSNLDIPIDEPAESQGSDKPKTFAESRRIKRLKASQAQAKERMQRQEAVFYAGFMNILQNISLNDAFKGILNGLEILDQVEDDDEEDGSNESTTTSEFVAEESIGIRYKAPKFDQEVVSNVEAFQHLVGGVDNIQEFIEFAGKTIVGSAEFPTSSADLPIILAYAHEARDVGVLNGDLNKSAARLELLQSRAKCVRTIDEILTRTDDPRKHLVIHLPEFQATNNDSKTQESVYYSYMALAHISRKTLEKITINVDVDDNGVELREGAGYSQLRAKLWFNIVFNSLLFAENLKCIEFTSPGKSVRTIFSVDTYKRYIDPLITTLTLISTLNSVIFNEGITVVNVEVLRTFMERMFPIDVTKTTNSITSLDFRIHSTVEGFYDSILGQPGLNLSKLEYLRLGPSIFNANLWKSPASQVSAASSSSSVDVNDDSNGHFEIPSFIGNLSAIRYLELNAVNTGNNRFQWLEKFVQAQESGRLEELHVLLPMQALEREADGSSLAEKLAAAPYNKLMCLDVRIKEKTPTLETQQLDDLLSLLNDKFSRALFPLYSLMVNNVDHQVKDQFQEAKYQAFVESASTSQVSDDDSGRAASSYDTTAPSSPPRNPLQRPRPEFSLDENVLDQVSKAARTNAPLRQRPSEEFDKDARLQARLRRLNLSNH